MFESERPFPITFNFLLQVVIVPLTLQDDGGAGGGDGESEICAVLHIT